MENTQLYLFSTPGVQGIQFVLQAARACITAGRPARLCYLPWANRVERYLEFTRQAFAGLAEIEILDPDTCTPQEARRAFGRSAAVYIPGGNTYLLNHRLQASGVAETLRRLAQADLPIIGFSAGALVCGPNLLTTHDINMLPTTHFNCLGLLTWNIVAHYPLDAAGQAHEDDWLGDYQALHTNPILALADGAGAVVQGSRLRLDFGQAWRLLPGEKASLPVGQWLDLEA